MGKLRLEVEHDPSYTLPMATQPTQVLPAQLLAAVSGWGRLPGIGMTTLGRGHMYSGCSPTSLSLSTMAFYMWLCLHRMPASQVCFEPVNQKAALSMFANLPSIHWPSE